MKKISRNDPCPCGSGHKFKQCCQAPKKAQAVSARSLGTQIVKAIQAAVAHHQAGRLPQAEAVYQQILQVSPNHPDALHYLGMIAHDVGKIEMAVELISKAIRANPSSPMYYINLGNALKDQGKLEAAVESYQQALSINPDIADAHFNLGFVLRLQGGKLDEAVERFQKALSIKPDFAEAHNNLGNALLAQGKLDAAVESYLKVIAIKPDFAEAYNNLGNALKDQGKLDAAVEHYEKALAIKPDFADAYSNLLFSLNYDAQCFPEQRLAKARLYGGKLMEQAKPYTTWQVHPTGSAGLGMRPLRIGLVSGDLRTHPVGFFLESILAHLNPAQVELVAYSTNRRETELTARIKPHFSAWNTLAGLSDEAAARKIHADGIHILIDLAGHTAHNRLPVFAWKPAPVQVSWLGYFATTGVPGVDYLLADPVSVPVSHREHFTEKVWYLPDTRLCFTPPAASAGLAPSPLPAARNGYITFGCFQNMTKVNDAVLDVWGRIINALPQARLRLQSKQMNCPVEREHLQQRLARVGIRPEQVAIAGAVPREAYLEAHADVDIILDTFPYPGGATTCEALWMGVPTLTLAGGTMLARQGASLLTCAGLEDWVASSEDDYVARALVHASNINRLVQLRSSLRSQLLASPLCNAPLFARNLENTFQGMWQAYCSTL